MVKSKGMKQDFVWIEHIPAVVYGEASDCVYLYVHGKMGQKEEALPFAEIAASHGWQVLSIDLPEHGARNNEDRKLVPWHVVTELQTAFQYCESRWNTIALYAVSIGAWFAMESIGDAVLSQVLLVSPVLDMCQLIKDMMSWASVSEEQLEREKEILVPFGEALSWEYYQFARQHPGVLWDCPISILYGTRDSLTSMETIRHVTVGKQVSLTVVPEGEHWFHTPEQLSVLRQWEQQWCSG